MTISLTQALADVRSLINEPVEQFWSDQELTQWLNQACKDVQQVAEWKRTMSTVSTTEGVQTYVLPSQLLRVYRVEFIPENNSAYTYSLEFRGYNEMDAAWGNLKTLPSAYPEQYTLWKNPDDSDPGTAGLNIILYPVPAQDGTLRIYYYPTIDTAGSGDDLDILVGFDTLIENFAAYRALQKDADPRWADFKKLYDEQLVQLIDVSRQYTDQANWASTGQQNYNPLFLDLED